MPLLGTSVNKGGAPVAQVKKLNLPYVLLPTPLVLAATAAPERQ
jgi:hypothetical protein